MHRGGKRNGEKERSEVIWRRREDERQTHREKWRLEQGANIQRAGRAVIERIRVRGVMIDESTTVMFERYMI